MLQAGWLIVHLIAGAMSAPESAATAGPAGMSCTYQACMAKCTRLDGTICHSYCEVRLQQRVARGVCTGPGDVAVRSEEIRLGN
jgi:hypothetical protein